MIFSDENMISLIRHILFFNIKKYLINVINKR